MNILFIQVAAIAVAFIDAIDAISTVMGVTTFNDVDLLELSLLFMFLNLILQYSTQTSAACTDIY